MTALNDMSIIQLKEKIISLKKEIEIIEHNREDLKEHLVTLIDLMISILEGACDPTDCEGCLLVDEAKQIKISMSKIDIENK